VPRRREFRQKRRGHKAQRLRLQTGPGQVYQLSGPEFVVTTFRDVSGMEQIRLASKYMWLTVG
jgi:hypothetical protein